MVGNDFDHIHIRNELNSKPSSVTNARPTVVTVLGTSMLWRPAICVSAVRKAAMSSSADPRCRILDDHVQISQQCWVVLHRPRCRQIAAALGQSGRILFGDGENHFFEDCTGALVEPTGHTEVDKYDLAAPDDDIAGMWVSVEEAVVENLRGVIVDELGADLLQVITSIDEPARVGDGDAVDVLHDHHMLGAQFGVRRRAVHVFESGGETLEFGEIAGLDQKVSLRFEGVPQLLDHALQVHDL